MLKKKRGFTLVEIMIVVAIIGILVAIAIPGFLKARTSAQKTACQENLQKIHGAKESYALEAKLKTADAIPVDALWPADGTGWLPKAPECPAAAGAPYVVGAIGIATPPTCPSGEADHELQ